MSFVDIITRKRDDLAELELFSAICARSLQEAVKAVDKVDWQEKTAKLLEKPSPFKSEEGLEKAKAKAERIANFAKSQTEGGSPYLYSLCAVRLWALLESLVDELVVEALRKPTEFCDAQFLGRLKGPLVEFSAASQEEQAEFLAEVLKQAVDAPLKLGVGKFEAMLDPVKIAGLVDESVRKVLFELSQIRNVIVHKSGKADRRFVDSCPWLSLHRGADVVVTFDMFHRHLMASYWYLVELRGRIDERGGSIRSTKVGIAQDALVQAIQKVVPLNGSDDDPE